MSNEKCALLLVDHGSKRQAANNLLEAVANLTREQVADDPDSPFSIVEFCHMELAEPSIDQGVTKCVELGATRIVVALYFLAPGRHSMSDIPRMACEAACKHDGILITVADPLGLDGRLVDLAISRAADALAEMPNEPAPH